MAEVDVEMLQLRRSDRIAALEARKNIAPTPTPVSAPQPSAQTKKKSSIRKSAKKTKSGEGVVMRVKRTKNKKVPKKKSISKKSISKISDMFGLAKKYSKCLYDLNNKYAILKSILATRKDLEIQNSINDLFKHHVRIATHLAIKGVKTEECTLGFQQIENHIHTMLDYPEILLLEVEEEHDRTSSQQMQVDGVNDLITSFSKVEVSYQCTDLTDILGKMCIL